MQPVTPTTVVVASPGTTATPGTVTSDGVDWSRTYQPDFTAFASCGAVTAGGTVVATVEGSNDDSNYSPIGSTSFFDAAGGTTIQTVDVDPRSAVYRYYRTVTTITGGTVTGVTTGLIGMPYYQ